MFTNLWYQNLFYISNTLIFLAIFAYGWLYLDAYLKTKKHVFDLIKFIGAAILSAAYLMLILKNLSGGEVSFDISATTFMLQSLGIFLILNAEYLQPIPKIKNQVVGTDESSILRVEILALSILFLPFSFLNTLIILHRTITKVVKGLSKEYRLLIPFWIVVFLNLLYSFVAFVSTDRFTSIEEVIRPYTVLWTLALIILLLASAIILTWIYKFIRFRSFAQIFFSTWLIIILFSSAISASYSVFTILNGEDQIYKLLSQNVNLLSYTVNKDIDQKTTIVKGLSIESDIITQIKQNETSSLKKELDRIMNTNAQLDTIIVASASGQILYDYERDFTYENSLGLTSLIQNQNSSKAEKIGYFNNLTREETSEVVHYSFIPVFDKDQFVGSITGIIRIDDAYLDRLKEFSKQEILIYTGNTRSASTIIQSDGARLETIPINFSAKVEKDDLFYSDATIVATPYYLVWKDINSGNDDEVKLILAASQKELLTSTQKALTYTFTLTLALCLLAVIPSYFFAKRLEKNLMA